ncbi:hypothetical protein IQ255_11730 [Pleurocapsales cyanobacterium LEGE 10410]|nr:hypothetical protein [Pleurocapsales cyanobacterium LEGE 10410]
MLTILNNIVPLRAIAFGFTLATIYSLPLVAQTDTPEDLFEDIQAGENATWNFTSEEETLSIENNLEELGEYSISNSELDTNIELKEENRRWGNNLGGPEEYSIETEIYDY